MAEITAQTRWLRYRLLHRIDQFTGFSLGKVHPWMKDELGNTLATDQILLVHLRSSLTSSCRLAEPLGGICRPHEFDQAR